MEVMNSQEFEQNDVLIGGSGKTGKFTVTNDPHLMSMLSTSLYQNPLRTMIQEITFNAWDAQKKGNHRGEPIDLYLNNTTGLIVRDYGPGIPAEDIDKIYCTYGQSTKRQDDDQTGGFGLGSKSPYAYNESFMVANHHGQKKTMYVMRRAHDENDGGPGYDTIVENVDTEEEGLLVTVPLKSEADKQRAYKYLKDILYLSGIKVNIHYEGSDEEVETVEAESLAHGEFITGDEVSSQIWAVYGGVKYEIMEHETYEKEYNFLRKLAGRIGELYIGFGPNTLTPLPSREGLNMREKSIESITTQLETIYDHFYSHMIPATKAAMIEALKSAKASTLQDQFVLYKWLRVGDALNLEDVTWQEDQLLEAIEARCPATMNKSVWTSVAKMSLKETRFMTEMIGYEKFYQMKSLIWAKEFPERKAWRFRISERGNQAQKNVFSEIRADYASWLIGVQKQIEGITEGENKPRVRSGSNTVWNILTNQVRAGKTDQTAKTAKQKEVLASLSRKQGFVFRKKFADDGLWFQKSGDPLLYTMKQGVVILAKTAAALQETEWRFQKYMVPKHPTTYGYDRWNWTQWTEYNSYSPIAAFVVHKKKGQYEAVKALLESQGLEVIEADEPQPKAKRVVEDVTADGETIEVEVRRGPPPMYVVNYRRTDWEGDEEIKKPSTYLYCTKTELNSYDKDLDKGLVQQVMEYAPKMVMIHNSTKAKKLDKQGVLSFEERIEVIVKKLLSDKERMRIMRLHQLVHDEGSLPADIVTIPEMSKILGLPYLRTRQKDIFERDRKFLARFLQDYRRHYYRSRPRGVTIDLCNKVKQAFEFTDQDDSVALVRKMVKSSRAFDSDALRIMVQSMKPGEKKIFAQKIARFLRTV